VSSAIATRVVVYALSFAAHGAVFAAAGAHMNGASSSRPSDPVTDAVVLEIPAPAVEVEEPKKADPAESHAAPQTHTHDYPVPASHDTTPHDQNLVHVPVAVVPAPPSAPAQAPDSVVAAPSEAPHFTMVLPTAPSSNANAVHGAVTAGDQHEHGRDHDDVDAPGPTAPPVAESVVDEPARCLVKPRLAYPAAAENAAIEADVPVEIVVDASGAVTSARVLSLAGYGLDEAAARGVRTYRFSPAKRHGVATAVRMRYVVQFELR
jgi:TonB family protein